MKRVLLVAASVAMLAGATVAAAQPYQYDQYRQQRDGQYSQQYRQQGDGQYSQQYRYNGRQRGYQEGWQQGYRMPGEYRSSQYRVNDYRNRGWRAPPRGYAYYRRDNGDTVLAAIATGLIASVIANGQSPRYDRYGHPY